MYRCKLYKADRKEAIKIEIINADDFLIMDEKIIISPAKFINGGAAILLAAKINHQIAILGKIEIWPFVIRSLRVLVSENSIPANANNAEEHSP